MAETYQIKQGLFEGPFELLLGLIEKKKLSINDVSLSQVAEGYFEYLKTISDLPVAHTAHFLLVASTMMLIKSVSLLPTLKLSEEEEASIEELEKRLAEYKRMKQLAGHLKERFGKGRIYFQSGKCNVEPIFTPHDSIKISALQQLLTKCLNTIPVKEDLPETRVTKVMSLEEMIDSLRDRIQENLSLSFSEFAGGKGDKGEKEEKLNVIVGFLALLELVKQEVVTAVQSDNYQDIKIETGNNI